MIICNSFLNADTIKQYAHYYCKTTHVKRRKLVMLICCIVLFIIPPHYIYKELVSPHLNFTFFSILLFGFFYGLYGLWLIFRGMEKRMYVNTYKHFFGKTSYKENTEIIYIFTNDGITEKINENAIFLKWEPIKLFLIDKDYYFFTISSQSFDIIPKNGFTDSSLEEFEMLVKASLPSKVIKTCY